MENLWKTSNDLPKETANLENLKVSYLVNRREVKYPRLEIKPDKSILVILPLNNSENLTPEKFLIEKKKWIVKKFEKIDRYLKFVSNYEKELENKAFIFGKFYDITIERGTRKNIVLNGNEIKILTPNERDYHNYLKKWIKGQLRQKTNVYISKYSKEMHVEFNKVFIKSQKNKWASCSSKANLNLNLKLAALPEELIEYIVIHELAHLKDRKHNEKFWALVKKYCPHYKVIEDKLGGFWFLIERNCFWNEIEKIKSHEWVKVIELGK
ncbi:MAG: YgjP-like metallopeptidase domain-containing protein [Halobacteriota archaeon]